MTERVRYMHYWQSYGWVPSTPWELVLGVIGGLMLWVILIWSLLWKGMSLWKAAQLGSKKWFVVLLITNTLGILDILYIYIFSKKHKS